MPLFRTSLLPTLIMPYSTGLNPGYAYVYPPIGTPNTLASVQSIAYAIPWVVPNTITLLDVGVDLAGSVGSAVVRQAVYYDNNGYPGALMQDFGLNSSAVTISGTQAAGVYFLGGLLVPLVVPAGFYWFAWVSQGAAASIKGATTGIGYSLTSTSGPAFATAFVTGATVTGAFPNPFPSTRGTRSDAIARCVLKIK